MVMFEDAANYTSVSDAIQRKDVAELLLQSLLAAVAEDTATTV